MAHRSLGRDRYFSRLTYTEMSPDDFVMLMEKSPYKAHRKAAPSLKENLQSLKDKVASEISQEEFAKTLGIEKLTEKSLLI